MRSARGFHYPQRARIVPTIHRGGVETVCYA